MIPDAPTAATRIFSDSRNVGGIRCLTTEDVRIAEAARGVIPDAASAATRIFSDSRNVGGIRCLATEDLRRLIPDAAGPAPCVCSAIRTKSVASGALRLRMCGSLRLRDRPTNAGGPMSEVARTVEACAVDSS
ncbi:hypothetical protein [Microbacterium sp. che218]|uniref:hypothetical protein n=1 Tax=Microbacterium sp. che218 TaxID=3140649 RepID=UPI00336C2283